jgi:hypothetical protein
MKNITQHTGKLEIIQREPNSLNGNPRFLIRLNGWTCKTIPNSSLAYTIESLDGKTVKADLGTYYGSCHVENVRKINT